MAKILRSEPLSKYCTYRTGGEAALLALPKNFSELLFIINELSQKPSIPFIVIGYGSNILVSDRGFPGVVISMRDFETSYTHDENCFLYCGAGVSLSRLVEYACNNGLQGLENLAGIPGSVGGALAMNAGAFGTDISVFVKDVQVIKLAGKNIFFQSGCETESASSYYFIDDNDVIQYLDWAMNIEELYAYCVNGAYSRTDSFTAKLISTIGVNVMGFGYRKASALDDNVVLWTKLSLNRGGKSELNKKRREILHKRALKQPLEYPSCGSVFKNLQGESAAMLIERSGLKGTLIGGAVISEKHANFIVNTGNATSTDIYNLIQLAKETVLNKTGILLEEEVRCIGVFGN